jgi:hypothetical protein
VLRFFEGKSFQEIGAAVGAFAMAVVLSYPYFEDTRQASHPFRDGGKKCPANNKEW